MFCCLTAVQKDPTVSLSWHLWTLLCCWQLTVQNNVLLPLSRTCHKNVTRSLPVVLLTSSRELFISLINNRRFPVGLICHERLHLPSETTVQETSSCKCIIDTEQADKLIKWESSLYISVPVWVSWMSVSHSTRRPGEFPEKGSQIVSFYLSVDKSRMVSSKNYHAPYLVSMTCEISYINLEVRNCDY
jgi:hypothetical protein